ncbi:MAG: hypothetical protein O2U62_06440 [Candidatus Bathyarchaeota archaeon]|nr:hypothetical protein [Candidatus Bathyarchaeota archaeon]
MNSRAVVIASCWLAVAIISSVYIWVGLGEGYIGDIMFGLYVPIGLLILVAFIVTFGVPSGFEPDKKLETVMSSKLQDIKSKLDALTREVEEIKKTLEE